MESETVTHETFESNIRIADEVIGTIAALAATDIDGVAGMSSSNGGGFRMKLGSKATDKGVRSVVEDDTVSLTLSLIVEYGCRIPEISRQVQEKVSGMVTNMTGFTVSEVNIIIDGIRVPES